MLVIGPGAVGCAVAIATVSAGMETSLIARDATAKYIRKNGLRRVGIFGEASVSPNCIKVYEGYNLVPSDYDYTIVAVKTTSNDLVAKDLEKHRGIIGKKGKIIL